MHLPFWLKLSIVIFLGILFGTWFAGESTRKLDTEYLLDTIRDDMQRTTGLLAGLISESVVTGDARKTEATIKQYVAGWSEFTYIHVLDDNGNFVTEWQKRPIKFGPDTRKFEQAIEYGGKQFGILSVYADLSSFHAAVEDHISTTRRQAALILLSITMFIVFFVNFFAFKDVPEDVLKDER
jgi:hypothetical protein